MIDDDKLDLTDLIAELTRPVNHAEHYTLRTNNPDGTTTWRGQNHYTKHPALIDQLQQAVEASAATEAGGGARPGFASKPAARLEALDAYVRIDTAAARWVRDLREDDPADTKACIRLLGGLMPSAPEVVRRAVTADVRRWWSTARVLSGWDSPAWRPANTCPLCGVKGGLRVKLAIEAASCIECGEAWDKTTIGLLADHIRAEAAAEHRPGANAMPVGRPCHCHACDPGYRFWVLCPTCGHQSERCAKPSDHRFPCTGISERISA